MLLRQSVSGRAKPGQMKVGATTDGPSVNLFRGNIHDESGRQDLSMEMYVRDCLAGATPRKATGHTRSNSALYDGLLCHSADWTTNHHLHEAWGGLPGQLRARRRL